MSGAPSRTAPPILVVSCDRYADVWAPFFHVFRKRWPDCPFPVALGANTRGFSDPSVRTLLVGEDRSWALGVRSMLEQLAAPRVILFLEDFLLTRPVDTSRVTELVDIAARQDLHCLKLVPKLEPTRAFREFPGLGVVPPGAPYRVTTQVSVWRTETLLALLQPEFSAWEFEEKGSRLSDTRFPEGFWGVYRPAVHYTQSVERGMWTREGLAICRLAGAPVDLRARPAMPLGRWLRRWAGYLVNTAREAICRPPHRRQSPPA